jgi:hypothetical protein
MRRVWLRTAAGLGLVPLVGLGLVYGSELSGSTAQGGKVPLPPITRPVPRPGAEEGCGSFGTQVKFVSTPSAAAARARKEEKLVFVLHVSGHFENPRFT